MSGTREDEKRGFAKAKDEIPGFENDVFLVFKSNTADEKKVRKIASELKKKNLSCESHEAFTPGCPVVTNIVNCIENSKTTLLLLSKESINSSWVLLETILALEQSKCSDRLILKIVLEGVCESDVKFLKKDLLASVPHFQLDFSDDGWGDQLATYVKEEVKLPDILPVGSLAHGLVFSHFIGFCRYALPELKRQLPDSDVYKRNPGRVSTKYYVLIPSSCKTLDTLQSVDNENNITIKEASSLNFEVSHAGKPRKFCIRIYSIQKEGEEPYYFFADTPNVLNAIYRMENEGLAKVDMIFQVARFYHTMNEVVNHSLNQPCNDVVELLPYNDPNVSMQKILLDAIKHHLDTNTTVTERIPHRFMDPNEKRQENDVTILCRPDVTEDCEIATNIAECLRAKGISVYADIGIQGTNFSEMNVPQANWYIFVISKSTLEFNNPLAFKCIACLHESVCENSLCVLPVTVKVKPHEIPALIRWVTLVSAEEPNYLDVILQTIHGKPVKMKHRIPCGDVATGLAWANYINYLSVTLKPGLQDRIEDVLKREKIECYCIEKLFIFVPWSCKAEEKLHDAANDGLV
ncbi:stimulator of interferon genes protein-like [Mercenaria mercenaria]|uniref:stimulator of interferon genes protein-like n=1 Tax=Mercenaria mercenaria TaxID=6596 RepID=UPI00234EA53A|nr:stimulator of interferon genes protein-like [Mercenaria mercenaria]XP_053404238.1 stimulator of interferon genes protein-like [Mercenaria mercenaria]XP_053404239.1 stimulator of interferon genes protein-like [Mercenaria mercenaria]XP_053404240.1 stimulator of interferon genes protein-like [Mercenaria mercenaria]XP_053404241.1 stimulator of interferon genes protein-like [Mercenaria mercenaria]XP_053404242.1 stimulator of interferon genes protein-like [Mercenaria mercenaria]XP_053404243.1 st